MKEKTYTILLVVLAVLLAASIFLNGWLLHERISTVNIPSNEYLCRTDDFCIKMLGEEGAHCQKPCDYCVGYCEL